MVNVLKVKTWLFRGPDPDEVIYDDVPRENSDSNTGQTFFILILYHFPSFVSSLGDICSSLSLCVDLRNRVELGWALEQLGRGQALLF